MRAAPWHNWQKPLLCKDAPTHFTKAGAVTEKSVATLLAQWTRYRPKNQGKLILLLLLGDQAILLALGKNTADTQTDLALDFFSDLFLPPVV
jgi:hypothetical protein